MNIQSNAVPGSFDARVVEPRAISETQRLYWSVRREIWENRSIYLAPLAVAGLFFLGFTVRAIRLPAKMRALALDPMQLHEFLEGPYTFAALLIMGTTFIVGIFYCLDALHGERRDRSILFWKSLPVSDLTTVLSKASIPIVILPLVTFGVTVALWIVMLLLSSAVLLGSGVGLANASLPLSFFQMSAMLLFHLVGLHGLWWAPFWGWLLLVSAWARRAPFLWATLPLFVIGVMEKLLLNTTHFASMLGFRFSGSREIGSSKATGMSMAMLNHQTLGEFLVSPGLWIGLAIAAVFLAAAVRLRRHREPI